MKFRLVLNLLAACIIILHSTDPQFQVSDLQAPAAPGAFIKTDPYDGQVVVPLDYTLSWQTAPGAGSYDYCISSTGESGCTNWISTGTATSVAPSGLQPLTVYTWQVRAFGDGEYTYADGVYSYYDFTTLPVPPGDFHKLTPPDGTQGTGSEPTLSWEPSSYAADYEYCYRLVTDPPCTAWTYTGNAGKDTSIQLSGLDPEAQILWQVRANNASNTTYADGSAGAEWSFSVTAPPAGFSKVSPIQDAGQVGLAPLLDWADAAGATSYTYCIDESDDGECDDWTIVDTATSVHPGDLKAGTDYYWQVRAHNPGGETYANGGLSAFWHFQTLALPMQFNKLEPSDGQVNIPITTTLRWQASLGADDYLFCLSEVAGACPDGWISIDETQVQPPNLVAGKTYYWQARAVNDAGSTDAGPLPAGMWSFTVAPLPGAFGKLAPPQDASAIGLTPTLEWEPADGAYAYSYCIDSTDDDSCTDWVRTTLTQAQLNLQPGKDYYWQVQAHSGGGVKYANIDPKAFWHFQTLPLPALFDKLAPIDGQTGVPVTTTLEWGASAGAEYYQYCISTISGVCPDGWIGAAQSTWVQPDLEPGQTYYWQVRAGNASGETEAGPAPSEMWSFTVAALPTAFDKVSPMDGSVGVGLTPRLDWEPTDGALSYSYCIDTSDDGKCTGWSNTGTTTSASPGGLLPGTTYFWQVLAHSPGGDTYANGDLSAFWRFETLALPVSFDKLDPPDGLIGAPITTTLRWETSPGAEAYQYCLSELPGACPDGWISINKTQVQPPNLVAGKKYTWQARAVNDAGMIEAGPLPARMWSFTIAGLPGAFGKLAPSQDGTGIGLTPTLAWETSSGAYAYSYCIDSTDDDTCTDWVTTFADQIQLNLQSGRDYYWQVRAHSAGGLTYADDDPKAFWHFQTLPLPAPFDKISPADGQTGIPVTTTLAWNAGAGAGYYQYCLSDLAGTCPDGWIDTGSATRVQPDLEPGQTYYWQVRAVNEVGTTDGGPAPARMWSFTVMARPAEFNKVSPFQGAVQVDLTPRLDWEPSDGAHTYKYCIDSIDDHTCTGWTDVGTATSASPGGLQPGTAYFWQVQAQNSGGVTSADGGPTAFWRFETLSRPIEFNKLTPLDGDTALPITTTLAWETSPGAGGYEYCLSPIAGACLSGWIDAEKTTLVEPKLIFGLTYYWQVRAYNDAGATEAGPIDGSTATPRWWRFITLYHLYLPTIRLALLRP